jgi:hypothetical protein
VPENGVTIYWDGGSNDSRLLTPPISGPPPSTYEESGYRWYANQDASAAFGTGGVVTGDTSTYGAFAVALDSSYMYVAGSEGTGSSVQDWRIEKRRLDTGALETGFGINGVVTGDAVSRRIDGIAIDSTYMYLVGHKDAGYDWRIEKRTLATGALDTGFGTLGIVYGASDTLIAYDVAIDSTYMYVVGEEVDVSLVEYLRIEKRRLDNGNLVTAFDGDGIVTGAGDTIAYAIAIDSSSMYVVASEGSTDWRIEKRSLTTGALDTGFDGDGIITIAAGNTPRDIKIDSNYLYVVGYDDSTNWRIEKRSLTTGALDTGFGTNGVVTSSEGARAFALDIDSTYMYVVGDASGSPTYDWRYEKRRLDNGDLYSGYGFNGVISSATESETDWEIAIGSTSMYGVGWRENPDWRIEKRNLIDGTLRGVEMDVGSPLAAANSPATAPAQGTAFRLRVLIHVSTSDLLQDDGNFKIQYAQRSGACDSGFVGESYVDVTGATAIGYYDNSSGTDGMIIAANQNDPMHGSDVIRLQSYEEANNLTNGMSTIAIGEDGMWDFALVDNSAPASTTYCFRLVEADGSTFDTYSVIPEITTAP